MPTFIYRWEIPVDKREKFQADWKKLTTTRALELGLKSATLYLSGNDEYISITEWPTTQAWQKWKTGLRNHSFRRKYRGFQVSEPETLLHLVTVKRSA